MTKNLKLLALIPIVIVLLVVGYAYSQLNTPYQGEDYTFVINSGEGFAKVNGKLANNEIIASARFFHYYAKLTGKMHELKAGSYKIRKGSTSFDIINMFTDGKSILLKVTIPEGKNMYEVAKILEAKGVITSAKEFIDLCKSPDIIAAIGEEDAPSVEGYLFPETYMLSPNSPAKEVIQVMISQFKKQTKSLDLDLSDLTPHEIVILASIVEKETGAKWERPTIAGVYLNRLKKRMRLQADPTTIYGIWETYDGNLRKRHLLEKTPYNTYKIPALPLGPIANPSLAAIKAVLEPKEHSFIYFVSKNDGTHVFTSTYKEHSKAVDYWQKNRKRREGKSWRDLKQ